MAKNKNISPQNKLVVFQGKEVNQLKMVQLIMENGQLKSENGSIIDNGQLKIENDGNNEK